jgi:hypothetical protein
MRRILAGIGWFFTVYLGVFMFSSHIVSFIYQMKTGDTNAHSLRLLEREYADRFTGIIVDFSLVFTIVGTWAGIFPGTKKKPEKVVQAKLEAPQETIQKAA